ncbi:hypothetical protein KPH14_001644 [Odynerus spinipes]|uniref:Peptidase S1 domain-containing protein n=1 Tax=Odynerus spinipes TaxID=1348599 RepID=A0AAD9RZP9_9HYME|nr:hypothetical protein KPH14_001644 [Odynerus spinipes]
MNTFRGITLLFVLTTSTLDHRVTGQVAHGPRVKRIVGGKDADLYEFPFQVSLRYSNTIHICGGALISERHVLSAAHCVCELFEEPYDDLSVVTGTNSVKEGGVIHKVENVRCHPDYVYGAEDSWTHDLLVITLKDNVIWNSAQRPIDLPIFDTPENVSVVLSGWGRHHSHGPLSNILQKVTLTTISNEDCQKYYNNTILPSQMCTFERKGIGACKGDSGSPLTYNGQLVGIFSWTKPCAVGSPDVYTRVYRFMDFIKDAMR